MNAGHTHFVTDAHDDDPVTFRHWRRLEGIVGQVGEENASVREALKMHDEHVQQLIVATVKEFGTMLEESIERVARKLATDETLHAQAGRVAATVAKSYVERGAGRFLLSKWTAILAIIIACGTYFGWAWTLKAILGLLTGRHGD